MHFQEMLSSFHLVNTLFFLKAEVCYAFPDFTAAYFKNVII